MSDFSRRTVVRGVAWTTPVVLVASTAPAFATSLRKDPGINGWVLNSPRSYGDRWYTLRVNSNPSGAGPTADGAPYGLYVYDVNVGADNVIQDSLLDARIVYWIIGAQQEGASWSANSGHGSGWSAPVKGAPQVKNDGLTYTPYTFTYTGSFVYNPGDQRAYLQEFDTTAQFRQPNGLGNNVTYWTQRFITVNGTVQTFERRNGSLGTYSSGARMAQRELQARASESMAS